MIMLMSKANGHSRNLEAKFSYLVSFVPPSILHFGKRLGAFHHEINEVATPAQAAYDEDVGQNPQESPQVDVLVLVTFLLIHDRFLKKEGCSQDWSLRPHQPRFHPMKCDLVLFQEY